MLILKIDCTQITTWKTTGDTSTCLTILYIPGLRIGAGTGTPGTPTGGTTTTGADDSVLDMAAGLEGIDDMAEATGTTMTMIATMIPITTMGGMVTTKVNEILMLKQMTMDGGTHLIITNRNLLTTMTFHLHG